VLFVSSADEVLVFQHLLRISWDFICRFEGHGAFEGERFEIIYRGLAYVKGICSSRIRILFSFWMVICLEGSIL